MIDDTEKAIIKRLRLLEADHPPEGWPAVQMKDVSTLLRIIDREYSRLREIRADMVRLKSSIREQRTYF